MSNSALVVGTVDDADGESKRPGDAGDLPGSGSTSSPMNGDASMAAAHLVGWGPWSPSHRRRRKQRRPVRRAGSVGADLGSLGADLGSVGDIAREIENPPRAAPACRNRRLPLVIDLVGNRPRHAAGVEPSRRRGVALGRPIRERSAGGDVRDAQRNGQKDRPAPLESQEGGAAFEDDDGRFSLRNVRSKARTSAQQSTLPDPVVWTVAGRAVHPAVRVL